MAAARQLRRFVVLMMVLAAVSDAQEGGLLYHTFNVYYPQQLPNSHYQDLEQQAQTKYEHLNQYDRDAHGNPELAVVNGHSQGWAEYLNDVFNIQTQMLQFNH